MAEKKSRSQSGGGQSPRKQKGNAVPRGKNQPHEGDRVPKSGQPPSHDEGEGRDH